MVNFKEGLQSVFLRIPNSFRTIPQRKHWVQTLGILMLLALLYLPIGFRLGFLNFQPELDWYTVLRVTIVAFFMPGILEEGIFRALLIPHSTESASAKTLWISVVVSWMLFMVYHVHPFTPIFFKETAFLLGAGLLGMGCTVAYLGSGSLWPPVVIHWASVVSWLIVLGGLEKFRT